MKLHLILSMAAVGVSSAALLSSANAGPGNDTFIPCLEGTTDPICLSLRQPTPDVITEIQYPNGTVEIVRNKYTREELSDIRARSNIKSVKRQPGDPVDDAADKFIRDLTKRESAPPVCTTETQKWYDTNKQGYWYQSWSQVGNCFYCNQCTQAITTSFAVSETWTYGLGYKFDDVISASFSFTWGQTFTLQDTRTCQWNNVESGCHSIWYQPLMQYHDGYANYQTHIHCSAGQGSPSRDTYQGHNYVYANVNQGGNNGVNQGNLGCNSGCGGNDHRQCVHGNNGGLLWHYAN